MHNFKQLHIWQQGMRISIIAYRFINSLPKEERFSISRQIIRAAVSIPSNIAEGARKKSQKDFFRFIEIALGSCFELETQVLIVKSTRLTDEKRSNLFLAEIILEQKMLANFQKTLKTS